MYEKNLAFAESKAALEAVKTEIITTGKEVNDVKNWLDKTYQKVGEMERLETLG